MYVIYGTYSCLDSTVQIESVKLVWHNNIMLAYNLGAAPEIIPPTKESLGSRLDILLCVYSAIMTWHRKLTYVDSLRSAD